MLKHDIKVNIKSQSVNFFRFINIYLHDFFLTFLLSRGDICVANFIPLANGASQDNYFLPKSYKLAINTLSCPS